MCNWSVFHERRFVSSVWMELNSLVFSKPQYDWNYKSLLGSILFVPCPKEEVPRDAFYRAFFEKTCKVLYLFMQ